jgi:hypothetical protein
MFEGGRQLWRLWVWRKLELTIVIIKNQEPRSKTSAASSWLFSFI